MNVRYRVDLDQPERDELTAMLRSGRHPARKLKRAQILLAAGQVNPFGRHAARAARNPRRDDHFTPDVLVALTPPTLDEARTLAFQAGPHCPYQML